jgi:hypothetical protein
MFHNSLNKEVRKKIFVAFANFSGVNPPTKADFKLSMCWEEAWTIGQLPCITE